MAQILARANLKTVSEAKLAAEEIGKVLAPQLAALAAQAEYQSQVLHSINEHLAAIAAKS